MVEKSEDLVVVSVINSSEKLERVLTIFDFMKTKYSADFRDFDQPANTARLTDPAHAEALRAMVREG